MFLPENYESPTSSNNYFKPKEGENRIRILSRPILGWEDWKDNKPVRFRMDNKPLKQNDPKRPIRHFWSFIVFNYVTETIQIMHVTQGTIRKSIEGLCKDKDWGAPFLYDIKINKAGEGMDTEYAINPVPHKPVESYIIASFKDKPCNLDCLFTGGDPFSLQDDITPLAIDEKPISQEKESTHKISSAQMEDLNFLFLGCSRDYKNELMESLSNMSPPINDFSDLPLDLFDRLKIALKKNYDAHQKRLNSEVPF